MHLQRTKEQELLDQKALVEFLENVNVQKTIFDLKRAGFLDTVLAARLAVSPSTVCRWKSGYMRPRYLQIVALMHLHAEIAKTQSEKA